MRSGRETRYLPAGNTKTGPFFAAAESKAVCRAAELSLLDGFTPKRSRSTISVAESFGFRAAAAIASAPNDTIARRVASNIMEHPPVRFAARFETMRD